MSKRKAAKQRFCECGLNITQGNVQGKLRLICVFTGISDAIYIAR